jgi:hypothetical protein
MYPTLPRLRQLLTDELRQRAEEGCDVSAFAPRLATAPDDPRALLALYEELAALSPRSDFPYTEPSDLADIQAARSSDQPLAGAALPDVDAACADRIRGGWLGRCAGLMLGKPFECPPFGDEPGAMRRYLEVAGTYPLSNYATADPVALAAVGRKHLPSPACQRDQVTHVVADDDIHYTLMGLEVLEQHGAAFTTADVAHWWTHRLPAAMLFTAEEAAYRNLMLLGAQFDPHHLTPADWARVRTWLNPYREWIGAQIRADGWALACPGDVVRAAEFAWRDASLSHVKNGLYGAMCCAAMIAAAAVCDDPLTIVRAGLAQLPAQSRLAEAIRQTIAHCESLERDPRRFEEAVDWLWQTFGCYHAIHTINNAAAVVAALLLGGRDYEKVISIAVMCGWDTDCNGATAGCICGTMLGARCLPAKWIAPLNDTLRADILGFSPVAISVCADRHVAVARRLRA